jgi:uncharacterized protein YkwD
MKKTVLAILCILMIAGMVSPATAAGDELSEAAAFVTESGIFTGDDSGNLNLDKGLTRAELAVILTRMDYIANSPRGLSEWDEWGIKHFALPENRMNTFTDVPDWALPHIEYCYEFGIMKGIGGNLFAPDIQVNPKMACTVILRYCRIAETDWSYDTSVEKAQVIGIAPADGVSDDVILRGTMAVLIHRGMEYDIANAPPPAVTPEPVSPSPEQTSPEETPDATDEPAMTIDEMKSEVIRLTNEARVAAGLPELEVHPTLMETAQAKVDDWYNNHYYGHNSITLGTPGEQIRAALPNAKLVGENIAPWRETVIEVVEGWLVSEGHRANILHERFTHIGIGIIEGKDGGYWFSQQFAELIN